MDLAETDCIDHVYFISGHLDVTQQEFNTQTINTIGIPYSDIVKYRLNNDSIDLKTNK